MDINFLKCPDCQNGYIDLSNDKNYLICCLCDYTLGKPSTTKQDSAKQPEKLVNIRLNNDNKSLKYEFFRSLELLRLDCIPAMEYAFHDTDDLYYEKIKQHIEAFLNEVHSHKRKGTE